MKMAMVMAIVLVMVGTIVMQTVMQTVGVEVVMKHTTTPPTSVKFAAGVIASHGCQDQNAPPVGVSMKIESSAQICTGQNAGPRLCCFWCMEYWEANPHPSYVAGIPLPNAWSRRGGKGSASSVGKGSASSASSAGPDLEAKVEALQARLEELELSVKKVEELELSVKKLESMMENFIELTKVQASPMLEDGGDS